MTKMMKISEMLLHWIQLGISGLTKSDPGNITTTQLTGGSLILN